jgi:DNA polymerase III subunit epsilon
MRFRERPLAITDIETTGLDASVHEIVELALLVVDQTTFRVLDQYQVKIKPLHVSSGAKKALEVVGYSPQAWKGAIDLESALTVYAKKAKDAVFCSYNMYLAYSFLDEGFKRCGIEDPTDYHRLDIFTLAWSRLGMSSLNLDAISKKLGIIPEPIPRRAMAGALKQLEVLRALLYR